jgi:heptosyltransferase-2
VHFEMKTIVFYQPAFLGDVCLSVSALNQIRNQFPLAQLILVCRSEFVKFFEKLQVCDQALGIVKNNWDSYKACSQKLNELKVDYFFSTHSSMTSFRFIKSIKAGRKVGYSSLLGKFFFNQTVQKDSSLPEVLRQMQLIAALSPELAAKLSERGLADSLIPSWSLPKVTLQEGLLEALTQRLGLPQRYACVFPGSQWGTKRWPLDHYRQLIDQLSEKVSVLVMGSENEFHLCDQVASSKGLNLAGKLSLIELVHVISKAQVVVCNDSGAQHLASLVHVPTVSIFGPTVPSQGFTPWNLEVQIFENKNLKCRPCGKHGPQVCPLGTHECMRSISVSEVCESRYL